MYIIFFRKRTEDRLDKCTFTYSILPEDTDALSRSESDIADIEERICTTDECIFYLDEIRWRFLLRSLEDEFDLIWSEGLFYEFYFLELPLTTLRESGSRSSAEPIDECAFTSYHGLLLFVVFLTDSSLVELLTHGL